MGPRVRRLVVAATCVAAAAVACAAAVLVTGRQRPEAPLRFWARVSGPAGKDRHTKRGLHGEPGGPLLRGLDDLEVGSGCLSPTGVYRPMSTWEFALFRFDPELLGRLGGDRTEFEAYEIAWRPDAGTADGRDGWAGYVRATPAVPACAAPRADLAGTWWEGRGRTGTTWREDGTTTTLRCDVVWTLRADGTLAVARAGTAPESGRWGAWEDIVFLHPDGWRHVTVRMLAGDSRAWLDPFDGELTHRE